MVDTKMITLSGFNCTCTLVVQTSKGTLKVLHIAENTCKQHVAKNPSSVSVF